ncbi:hypothetical protein IHE55_19675 [Streptomyces pactum]|uniref:DUF5709 domain-containing protein n=1 Tax=Streptomyces pactum TaxID=68249 RepID=A0ABS0NNT2_9ACTN|nr:hypothetical protein [Streptomyces pactum]MBH5336866.1 hypothetical protein [Streptomyces pactum]
MTVEPHDPDTFEDEAETTEIGVEAPEADAAEQQADISPNRDEPLIDVDPASANEADRAEQARVVELNEDDYR